MNPSIRILIVEDEPPIVRHIEWCTRSILRRDVQSIHIVHTIPQAIEFLNTREFDLCLLDLNLKGENGFEILSQFTGRPFHTIIISAYTDQAIKAFEVGVLDFVPKPFTEDRLCAAFQRYFDNNSRSKRAVKYLSVRRQNKYQVISVSDIQYFKALGSYIQLFLKNGEMEFADKPLTQLMQILPQRFVRIHRSYIVDIEQIATYGHCGGGTYQVTLTDGTTIPLNRQAHKLLQKYFRP